MVTYVHGPRVRGLRSQWPPESTRAPDQVAFPESALGRISSLRRTLTPDFIYILIKSLRHFHLGHGAYPNLIHPRSFSEKIQYRKLFDRRQILRTFADKYAVRDYVRERGCAKLLSTLYHVTTDPQDIPMQSLPRRFVVKPTHGCGWIYIVRDRDRLATAELARIAGSWLQKSYFYCAAEWAYKGIKPHLLFEELLEDGADHIPYDYKFFVFDGRVQFISVDIDRYGDHRRNMYDREWNSLQFGFQRPPSEKQISPPPRLADMLYYAETLAAGFDFLRIDLYNIGDRIVFSEITPTPASGLEPFWPGGIDRWIGELWHMNFFNSRGDASSPIPKPRFAPGPGKA